MSLIRIFAIAAFALTASPVVRNAVIVTPIAPIATPMNAPLANPNPVAPITPRVSDDELRARVEIGPAVLRIYDAKGNVIAIE